MNDRSKTKDQLIQELTVARKRISELEFLQKEHGKLLDALARAEEFFRLLYEKAPVGYQSLDRAGCIIAVNQAWLDTFGYPRHQLLGKSFGDFLAPPSLTHFKKIYPRLKSDGKIHGVEFEMVRVDGSRIFVSFDGKVGHDTGGDFKQAHCVLHDITERKEAEERLKKSEGRYRALLDSASDAILIADLHGNLMEVNKKAQKLLGFTRQEMLMMNYTQLHPNEELGSVINTFREMAEGQDGSRINTRALRKDGTSVPVDITGAIVECNGEQLVQAIFRKVAEEE